ncbi:MAG: hypothetical protein ABS35_16050 [Kaistia sp. SCN 65-12]|nr:MAG: hypothetical protein ABS35_16050 [Kaistia sp. SCN 65-12]
MTDHESNKTAVFEGVAGPNLSYSWVAEVSREAGPQGLDGGRIQNLSVVKMRGPQRGEAPGFDEAEAYQAWLAQQPSDLNLDQRQDS